MISVESFVDELVKIGAAKCRSGSAPIRVHNLVKKSRIDKSNSTLKTAASEKNYLARVALPVAAGILGWEGLKGAHKDWKTGRAYRKQMEQAQRGR